MSDPTPLTLRSLQRYADAQEEIIHSVLQEDSLGYYFRNPTNPGWTRFWESNWGNPLNREEEKVVRDINPIDDSLILPDVVPSSCKALPKPKNLEGCWRDFKCEKFLIRDEYKEAHRSALATFAAERMYDAFIVTGQPGIGPTFSRSAIPGSQYLSSGKSIFLLLLLLQRLALKLPTIVQISRWDPVLFYKNGVKQLGQPNSGAAYTAFLSWDHPFRRIWALVDTDRYLSGPSRALRTGPFFVVEVTPPYHPHFNWIRDLRSKTFYMKPWSFSEVLQV